MITLPAGEFKAKCLKLMDLSHEKREVVVITKRGIPIAKLVPYDEAPPALYGFLKGTASIKGDIIEPTGEAWDAEAEND